MFQSHDGEGDDGLIVPPQPVGLYWHGPNWSLHFPFNTEGQEKKRSLSVPLQNSTLYQPGWWCSEENISILMLYVLNSIRLITEPSGLWSDKVMDKPTILQ